ncbi:MAG: hypothetical protein QCH31_04985 [Methanolobus sp.]|nr:hypothetical protein [Methanolobus sp.]
MNKDLSYGLFIIVAIVVIGLAGNMWSCGPVQVEGLLLVDGVSSIGSSDVNAPGDIYRYEFTLYNSGRDDIFITTVEPVLIQSPYIVSSQDSVKEEINSLVAAGSYVTVKGNIELDTADLSKEEVSGLEPILYVNVSSTQSIPFFRH